MARKKAITCESCGTREYMEKSIEVELKTGERNLPSLEKQK